MDPNLDQRLKSIEATLASVNETVVKMRKSQRAGAVMRVLYWVVIILIGFGSFYFIQPYLSQLKEAYGIGDTSSKSGNSQSINDLLKQLREGNN